MSNAFRVLTHCIFNFCIVSVKRPGFTFDLLRKRGYLLMVFEFFLNLTCILRGYARLCAAVYSEESLVQSITAVLFMCSREKLNDL